MRQNIVALLIETNDRKKHSVAGWQSNESFLLFERASCERLVLTAAGAAGNEPIVPH